MDYTLEIIKIIFYLLIVIGLIYALTYFFKNRMIGQKSAGNISIIERFYLNQKVSLVLVQVGEKVYLLGITDSGINVLDSWENGEFSFEKERELFNKNFKTILENFINNRRDKNE